MLVKLDGRVFVVSVGEDGKPYSIKERKIYAPGKPWGRIYNAPYWHKSQGLCGPKSRPVRILAEAAKNA